MDGTTKVQVITAVILFVTWMVVYWQATLLKDQLIQFRDQMEMHRKLITLDYVTKQLDYLDQKGSRLELKHLKDSKLDILAYTENDPEKHQSLSQYLYAFNRIGAGIFKGGLDQDVVFNIWAPDWFADHWKTFEPLAKKRWGQPGGMDAYRFFQWLAVRRCPEVRNTYPECRPYPEEEPAQRQVQSI